MKYVVTMKKGNNLIIGQELHNSHEVAEEHAERLRKVGHKNVKVMTSEEVYS